MIDLVCEHIVLCIKIVVTSIIAAVVCVILYFFGVISPKTTLYSVAVLGLPLIAFLFVYLAYEQLSLTGTTQLPSGAGLCKPPGEINSGRARVPIA